MFKNYFKIAMRSLLKRKGYFTLNIFGLVTGMTCCLFIFHYVSYERSYDRFQPLSQQIVRLRLDVSQNGKEQLQSVAVYPAIGAALKKDFPEVEDFCRLHKANLVLSNDEKNINFTEPKGFYADPSFLKMFDVNSLSENSSGLLNLPFQIILSESMSKKYFADENPVGKRLIVRNPSFLQTYIVTGVFKDYSPNSHLSFDYLLSYSTYDKILQHYGYSAGFAENSWEFQDFYTYLQIKKTAGWRNLQSKLPAFCNRYINSLEGNRNNNKHDELHLTPLKDIHLYSNYFYEAGTNGNGQAVSLLFLIAVFIICIAWINYINLAKARSVKRSKEVGVRKVLGAVRANLIKQFLAEGFVINIAALGFSLLIFYIFIGKFDLFTGKETSIQQLFSITYWKLFALLFLTGTLLSGAYPAFVMSGFNPIVVLQGIFKNSSKGIVLRRGLITSQFIISIALIAAIIIVHQQMRYMNGQPLGTDINQTLVLQGSPSISDTIYSDLYQGFKAELLRQPDIKNVTASTSVMGSEILWTRNIRRLDISTTASVPVHHMGIDYDFIPGYGIKLLAGRNFSKQFGTDNKTVLLNEKAVQLLGFRSSAEAINKKIKRSADAVTIAGVVANFHQEGLQKEIGPMVFLLMPDARSFYSLKILGNDIHKTVASIEAKWKQYFQNDPFNYFFLDEAFSRQYQADYLFKKVFSLFAFLAIIIACFGLLGLSAYNVLQRAREVSIRKVLGADVVSIGILLTKEFINVIVIAFLIASPVAWIAMNKWLQNFAYKVDIQWWVFAVSGLAAVFIALATIAFQVVRAALANPVTSLRTE
jgi:putative ABC transport system permease protein